jgi:hypothetical protein
VSLPVQRTTTARGPEPAPQRRLEGLARPGLPCLCRPRVQACRPERGRFIFCWIDGGRKRRKRRDTAASPLQAPVQRVVGGEITVAAPNAGDVIASHLCPPLHTDRILHLAGNCRSAGTWCDLVRKMVSRWCRGVANTTTAESAEQSDEELGAEVRASSSRSAMATCITGGVDCIRIERLIRCGLFKARPGRRQLPHNLSGRRQLPPSLPSGSTSRRDQPQRHKKRPPAGGGRWSVSASRPH